MRNLPNEQFGYLTTTGRTSGKQYEIEIWYGVAPEAPASRIYLMAGAGATKDWVKNIQANPQVKFRIGDTTYSGAGAVVENDPDLDQQIRDLVGAKYEQVTDTGEPNEWALTAWPVTIDLDSSMGEQLLPPFGVATGRIYEAHVQTTDIARAKRFYGQQLGLQEAFDVPSRGLVFYWIEPDRSMIGVWAVPQEEWHRSHFALEIPLDKLDQAMQGLRDAGIEVHDFWHNPADEPSVNSWMPAASIYFHDPDKNSLEFITVLPGAGRPDLGVVPLSEWYRITSGTTASE